MTNWPALASRETAFVRPALLLSGLPFDCLPPGAVGLLADVFDTDADVREALYALRHTAKQFFAPQMGKALQKYVQANNGQLPTDVSQLTPYFESPVDDATLARYQMIRTGAVGDLQPDEMIVAEKAAVDDEYDELFQIGLYGQRFQGVGKKTGENGASSWP